MLSKLDWASYALYATNLSAALCTIKCIFWPNFKIPCCILMYKYCSNCYALSIMRRWFVTLRNIKCFFDKIQAIIVSANQYFRSSCNAWSGVLWENDRLLDLSTYDIIIQGYNLIESRSVGNDNWLITYLVCLMIKLISRQKKNMYSIY